MANIYDRGSFKQWLQGKPASWAQIIACRSALRVVPLAGPDPRSVLITLRAVSISFSARNIPAKDFRVAAAVAHGAHANYADHLVTLGRPVGRAAAGRPSSEAAAAAAAAAATTTTVTAYATATAEYALDATAAASAVAGDAVLWRQVEADVAWLEAAESTDAAPQRMTGLPLWRGGRPDWFGNRWSRLEREMRAAGGGPLPLLNWFERRIEGHATAFALPPAEDQALQIRIALQKDEFWNRSFAAVNADIQAWIDELAPAEPQIPPQHPSDLQTELREGHIALVQLPPEPIERGQDARRQQAWQAIRIAVDDYLADGPTNNHPRLDRMMARLSAALGASFAAFNPIGLGIQAQYLQQYASRADDFLIAERAADLVGLNATVGSLLPRFPEWAAYQEDEGARANVSSEALSAAAAVVAAINREDIAEPELNGKLAELVGDAQDEASITDPDEPTLQVYRRRLLSGLGNVLATGGRLSLDWIKGRGGAFTKGIDQGLESAGKRATQALFLGAANHLLVLAGLYPDLSWLGPLLTFLRDNLPKG